MSNPEYFECPRCHLPSSISKGILCENCTRWLGHKFETGQLNENEAQTEKGEAEMMVFHATKEGEKDMRAFFIRLKCLECKQEWGYMISEDAHLGFIQKDLKTGIICKKCFEKDFPS